MRMVAIKSLGLSDKPGRGSFHFGHRVGGLSHCRSFGVWPAFARFLNQKGRREAAFLESDQVF